MSVLPEQFLRTVSPFDKLSPVDLRALLAYLEVRRFAKGERIHRQGGPPGTHLYIVQEGAVKVFLERDDLDDPMVDFVRPGGTFGFPSLIDGKVSTATTEAAEDTTCLLLSRDRFWLLLSRNPAVAEHFSRSLAGRLKRTASTVTRQGAAGRSRGSEQSQSDVSVRLVSELMTPRLVTCELETEVHCAAQVMVEKDVGSIVVVDAIGSLAGILTDTDLRRSMASLYSGPVKGVMSSPVVTIPSDTYAFEAIYEMLRHDIHHLVVTEQGRPAGVLSASDLLAALGDSPMYLARGADRAGSIRELAEVHGKVTAMVSALASKGASAHDLGRITAETNDRVVQKALALVEARLEAEGSGTPPVPYCWLSLGSEGRREQTLKTDQDNALVYLDPLESRREQTETYFRRFASRAIECLEEIGFPPCKGDVMASNPEWCQPLTAWKVYFSNWIRESDPANLLNATIFFDFRGIAGDVYLGDALREHLNREVAANKIFVGRMAKAALDQSPPIGFFRRIVVEGTGEHKGKVDLKRRGILPVVDAVRVYALDKGVGPNNTFERIAALESEGVFSAGEASDLSSALEFLMKLRIQNQIGQIASGVSPDNFVSPKALSTADRKLLSAHLGTITSLQHWLQTHYLTWFIT